jgi:hypothetical protein
MTILQAQRPLFPSEADADVSVSAASTFSPNMELPVHRWYRYSAGFSAEWAESIIKDSFPGKVRVFDPFCGSATTLIAAEAAGAECLGIEAHPFVFRIARAKLAWRADPQTYIQKIEALTRVAETIKPQTAAYPALIQKCYAGETLQQLDKLRQAYECVRDDTAASELAWLTIVSILRKVSAVGTAPWQIRSPEEAKTFASQC